MRSMTVSLPEALQVWLESEVQKSGLQSANEYLGQVLHETKAHRKPICERFVQGDESEVRPLIPHSWAQFRGELNLVANLD